MFLFRAHDFVSGGLAYCFGHGGSRYTVLSSGYPVRNALPRHLLLPRRSDKKRNYGLAWASFQIISRKNLRMGPPLGPQTCRTPLVPPTSVETIVRLCGSSTSGGRNKDSPTTAAKCWIVSAVKGGSELGDAAMAESTRWLIRPGCLPRSHPDVAHRIPAPSASSYVSTSRCCRCRCRRCGRKKGINGGGKWRACWIKYSITGVGPGLDVRMKQAEETKERNHRGYKKKGKTLHPHSCNGGLTAPSKLEH